MTTEVKMTRKEIELRDTCISLEELKGFALERVLAKHFWNRLPYSVLEDATYALEKARSRFWQEVRSRGGEYATESLEYVGNYIRIKKPQREDNQKEV